MRRWLTRFRVGLGFGLAAVVLYLSTPSPRSLAAGAVVVALGELLRLWAAGHLEKSVEVTNSGPYRYTRHPLYLGSATIAAGVAIAAGSFAVFLLVAAYAGLTLTAAGRSEEAHLREKFGDAYDAYAENRAAPTARTFSWSRALRNREHHTIAGIVAGFAALAWKLGN